MKIKKIIDKIYHTRFWGRIFHTTPYCLERALKDCESVLDLGCGPSSPLKYARHIKHSVGVEAFKPYLEETKERQLHSEYLESRVETVDFPAQSFDAVILIEVIEHLPKEVGRELLKKAEKWAKKKIIVSTPNGFWPQRTRDKNVLQKHLSGWSLEEMKKLGFHCRGLAGFKFLRNEVWPEERQDNFLASIKKRPKFFWFIIATLSQLFTYLFPKSAFELFCVKKLH